MVDRSLRLALFCVLVTACAPLGDARCDEPDHACDTPPSSAGRLSLRTLRTRAPRYPEGAPVTVRAVSVTAIDRYDETQSGRLGTIWAQEVSPPGDTADRFAPCPLLPDRSGRVCAISMFSPGFSPTGYRPVEGDLVDISGGAYNEFVCATCGSPFANGDFLPQVSSAVLVRAGVAPQAAPIPVTLDEILAHYRDLMGVLVTVENVTANTDPDARFGEMTIAGSGRTGLSLAPQLTPIPGARAGTRWDRITGVVTYFYNPKLLPRSPSDLVGQR
jgi:hypothetical protein